MSRVFIHKTVAHTNKTKPRKIFRKKCEHLMYKEVRDTLFMLRLYVCVCVCRCSCFVFILLLSLLLYIFFHTILSFYQRGDVVCMLLYVFYIFHTTTMAITMVFFFPTITERLRRETFSLFFRCRRRRMDFGWKCAGKKGRNTEKYCSGISCTRHKVS